MTLSIENWDRERQKLDAWHTFVNEIGDALYKVACNGKSYPDFNNEDDFLFWHLSEDARALNYMPCAICDFVDKLDYHREYAEVEECIDRMVSLLESHFQISKVFWQRTREPKEHEIRGRQR